MWLVSRCHVPRPTVADFASLQCNFDRRISHLLERFAMDESNNHMQSILDGLQATRDILWKVNIGFSKQAVRILISVAKAYLGAYMAA